MSFKNSFLPHQILWKVLFFIPRSAYLKPTATSPCSLSGPPSKSVCSLDLIVLSTNFPRPFPLFLHHHHCFMCERVGVVYCVVVWCVCMHVCVCVCVGVRAYLYSVILWIGELLFWQFFFVCVCEICWHTVIVLWFWIALLLSLLSSFIGLSVTLLYGLSA